MWYDKEPEGTMEEKKEAFEVASKYLYKILDFADKDEGVPKEVVDREKRIFAFCRQGPRASYIAHGARSKLVSADVLYILSSTIPAKNIALQYDIKENQVRKIRRGDEPSWEWEWRFVNRMRNIIKARLRSSDPTSLTKKIYSISKIDEKGKKEILYYISSLRKAKKLREDMLTKVEYKKITKDNTIDLLYPIDLIEVLT